MTLKLVEPQSRAEIKAREHISFSQLNTYLICPMKYAHSYIYRTPWETKPTALCFGSAIHKSVEHFYNSLKDTGEFISVENMIEVFTEKLTKEFHDSEQEWSFKEGENLETLRNQGIELVKLFHEEIEPQKIMAVEFPFSVSIPDLSGDGNLPIKLVGIFDLVEADADGTYVIGELKTAAQKFSSIRLKYDIQATTYSYAVTRLKLAKNPEDCLIRYDVLLKTKKPGFERYYVVRTEADHQRLIHLINQVHRAIENEVFYRQMDWPCADCQFKKACLD